MSQISLLGSPKMSRFQWGWNTMLEWLRGKNISLHIPVASETQC